MSVYASGVGIVLALLLAFRFYLHSADAVIPALITPAMNAHESVSRNLDARVSRAIHNTVHFLPAPTPRLLALTFDDGPYPVTTPLLLDRLHDLGVKATFFLIGRDVEQEPELTARIVADGHELADHTFTHPNLDRMNAAATERELIAGTRILETFTRDPGPQLYMRPPHGRFTEETIQTAQRLGYTTVLWNDDPGDWRSVPAATLLEHITEHATAPEILLLHNGRPATIALLGELVRRYRQAGYRFVTVDELLRQATLEAINHPHAVPLLRS